MRRAMQRFCRGERRTQYGKALAFSCTHSAAAAACSVMFALCKRLFSAAPCTPPAKISSKSAVSSGAGCTRSSAKLSVFSKPRYFAPISKSAVKNSSAESFSQQRRKYSLSSSFSPLFRQTTANHTPRECRTHRAESALSCGTKGTKTSRSRRAYKFLRPARKRSEPRPSSERSTGPAQSSSPQEKAEVCLSAGAVRHYRCFCHRLHGTVLDDPERFLQPDEQQSRCDPE